MDESWRMSMGISDSRRRPSEKRPPTPELEPEDFDDVFGGPPKSVIARKLSADFTNADWFYQEIFQHPESLSPATVGGRRLPEFVIPEQKRREIRSWSKCSGKCMTKSKSTSSSGLSFEELSPYLPPVGTEDRVDGPLSLSPFTSKLRPLNVPSRWSSSSNVTKSKKQELPRYGCNKTAYISSHGNNDCDDYTLKSFNYGFPYRTSSLEANSFGVLTMDDYDMQQLESPSSAVPSLSKAKLTSFSCDRVFDIHPWSTPEVNNSEAIEIGDAIAWAKEKFQGWSLDQEESVRGENYDIFGSQTRGDC